MSLGTLSTSGTWQIQQRQIGSTGLPTGPAEGDSLAAFDQVPLIWNGAELQTQTFAPSMYYLNGRWYNPTQNRFLSEGSVTATSPNPFTLNGNNPINAKGGLDWSILEGDNPGGLYFRDHVARLVNGIAEGASFGLGGGF